MLNALALTALENPTLHHKPRARRVLQIFLSGAASQCDTFDYKPQLIQRRGEKFDPGGKIELFQSAPGVVMPSPWEWRRHGKSGRWVSGLLPNLAECVDDMAFLYAMVAKSNVHGPATFLQNTGFVLPGFPSMGAWLSYGLGSLNDNLPTFVVLPDTRGVPPNGPANWGAGFLPAAHQGTVVKPGAKTPIYDLFPPERPYLTPQSEREGQALLERLNRSYQGSRPGDSRLEARLQSYALAAKLQLSAPEALDIGKETPATRALYGIDDALTSDLGRRCLTEIAMKKWRDCASPTSWSFCWTASVAACSRSVLRVVVRGTRK